MKNTTEHHLLLWKEARTRFTKVLETVLESDLSKRLGDAPNSLGFLIRHIAEVEFLFAKNVFGAADIKIIAKTVIAQNDTGEWTQLNELIAFSKEAAIELEKIISSQSESDWGINITTKEFGTKTKAEALGRIVSHTAYHAGQMALIFKYGK